jgi:PAS domain S-box-containing protein
MSASEAAPTVKSVEPSRWWNGQAGPAGTIPSIVVTYAGFAAMWVLLSDRVVAYLFDGSALYMLASTLKGWFFVAVTSALLYVLLRRVFGPSPQALHSERRRLMMGFAVIAGLVLTLTGLMVFAALDAQRGTEARQLEALARLKARQCADWVAARQAQAEFIRRDLLIGDEFRAWTASSDAPHARPLQRHLEQLASSRGFGAALLLDADGRNLLGPQSPGVAPELAAALHAAAGDRQMHRAGPYVGPSAQAAIDFVIPLADVGGALLWLHFDPTEWLDSVLQTWSGPDSGAELVLFRRDGDEVLFLNDLRHATNTSLRLRLPLAGPQLASRLLRGETREDLLLDGEDYRRAEVVGVAESVAGTDWMLLVTQERAQITARVLGKLGWVVLGGLLVVFVVGAGVVSLHQRALIAAAEDHRLSQDVRLRALGLLEAFADGSEDAIYAKDLDGRYILCNPAACRVVGMDLEQIIGRDDYSLFPAAQAERLVASTRRVISEARVISSEEALDTADGPRVLLATKGPLRDDARRIVGVFGIARDITAEKAREEALRESDERFHALVEQSLAGVFIVQDGLFAYANPRLAAMLGYTSPAGLMAGAVPGDLGDDAAGGLPRVSTARRHDGTRIEIEIHGRQFAYQGRPAVIGLILDITARRLAEESLRRQSEELAQRNAELERFNRAMVGRELEMIELKSRINALTPGAVRPYALDFAAALPQSVSGGGAA